MHKLFSRKTSVNKQVSSYFESLTVKFTQVFWMLPCIKTNAFIDKSDSSDFGSDLQFPSYKLDNNLAYRLINIITVKTAKPCSLLHASSTTTLTQRQYYLSMITWSEYDNACSIAALSNLESFTNRTALVSSPWLALTTHGYVMCSDSRGSPVTKEISKSIRFKLQIIFLLVNGERLLASTKPRSFIGKRCKIDTNWYNYFFNLEWCYQERKDLVSYESGPIWNCSLFYKSVFNTFNYSVLWTFFSLTTCFIFHLKEIHSK